MAESVGEGDFLHLHVEIFLQVHRAKRTIEGLSDEAEMCVNLGHVVCKFEDFGVAFEFDDEVLGSVFAPVRGVGVVLDFFGPFLVKGVVVHDAFEEVHIRLHVLLHLHFVELVPVPESNDFCFFGTTRIGFRVPTKNRLFGAVAGFEDTVTVEKVVVAELVGRRRKGEKGESCKREDDQLGLIHFRPQVL